MTPKPIDAHCHLFSARYVVEEAAAMGWAYITGNYPHAEVIAKGAATAAESLFSWSRLEDVVKWFFDLGAAVSSYETNYQSLAEACRKGLNLPSEEGLVVAPLMMDIFYMFGPPAGMPLQEVKAGRPVRGRKGQRGDEDREAGEAAFKRFQKRVIALAAERAGGVPKAKGRPAGVRISTKAARAAVLSAAEIDRIFLDARSKGTAKAVMRGLTAGRELSRGFENQIDALIELQARHAGSVFPFFAVDPRRRGAVDMAIRGIPELNKGKPLVTLRGPFFGVKLYTRLGYLPADVPDELYGHCVANQIPITVHTSAGGFPPGSDWEYADYATPRHWQAVLDKHPTLRLDFAHFGSGNPEWVLQILDLMTNYPNVYADLACYTDDKDRSEARRIWSRGGIIRERLLFGTDFVVSSLTKTQSLEGYFAAFRKLFGPADLETLMTVNTRKFLQPILPETISIPPERRVSAAVFPVTEEKLRRKLGWLPDLPDYRDHDMETDSVPRHLLRLNRHQTVKGMMGQIDHCADSGGRSVSARALPASVDLRRWCSPIEDQGQLGACTAHAAAALIEYYERRAFGSHIDISRLFLYKVTRNLLNWTSDTGAYLRTTMEAMVLFGVPPEEYFPYDPANVDIEPSAFCYSFAQSYQTLSYFRLDAARTTRPDLLKQIKMNLAKGIPAMFGFTVFGSIGSAAKTGRIPFPVKTDRREGGHAVAAVGYDDDLVIRHPFSDLETKGAILIRNSWGSRWGNGGYGWLPYEYVLHHLAVDWWTVLKQEWVDTNQFHDSVQC
jgi:C1A family cysteine protease/predicted TIM-barrel fold metal-dependent hydrolase